MIILLGYKRLPIVTGRRENFNGFQAKVPVVLVLVESKVEQGPLADKQDTTVSQNLFHLH